MKSVKTVLGVVTQTESGMAASLFAHIRDKKGPLICSSDQEIRLC